MARPAIIIGIGGTGQWIATYVKRDMKEANRGELPSNVKLLVFDTEVQPSASAATASAKVNLGGREVDAQTYQSLFGRVRLDETEYHHLGGDVREYSEAVSAGRHPHVGLWFDAEWFKRHQPQGIFMLREGAAAWRQFGRLAVFYDLRNRQTSKIWSGLTRAFAEIARNDQRIGEVTREQDSDQVVGQRVIEVIIATSIVGGTGAGMTIDIANLVRMAAGKTTPIALRGFFVLPQAFGAVKQGEEADTKRKRARAFATWRELDRFRLLGGATGGLPITYGPDFEGQLDRPLFDAVYMVDGVREDGELSPPGRPDLHVYPLLADFINVILDDKAGPIFSASALNLSSTDRQPHVPKYSSIGAYSMKSPVYYVMQEQTHNFAQSFLKEWLKIVDDPQRLGSLLLASQQGGQGGDGKRGQDVVLDFLASDSFRWVDPQGTAHEASSTFLPSEIKKVLTTFRGQEFEVEEKYILGAGRDEWWDVFTDLRSVTTNAIQDDLDLALEVRLADRAPASRSIDEEPADGTARLIGPQGAVPEFVREFYGGFSEELGRDQTGKYGQALARVRKRQVERFKQSLRIFMMKTLMGDSTNPREARAGKLGFTYDFLKGLVAAFDKYVRFLDHIERERQRMGIATELARESDSAQAQMEEHQYDKWPIINKPRPRAFSAQETFLSTKQDQIDARKDDLFYRAVRQTAEEMRSVVRDTLRSVESLNDVLIGNPDLGYTGLYRELHQDLERVSTGRSREAGMTQVQKMYELKVDPKMRAELLDAALNSIEWKVDPTESGLTVSCLLHPFGNQSTGQRVPVSLVGSDNGPRRLRTMAQDLVKFSESAFEGVWAANRIAPILMNERSATQLASDLLGKAAPLYKLSGGGQGGASSLSQWLRVETVGDTEDKFFDDVQGRLSELDPRITMQKRPGSEDPYRLTLARTDDLIPSSSFQEYDTSKDEYFKLAREYSRDFDERVAGRLLHAFPAEGNALRFEMELARLTSKMQILHPLVVAGLEDVDRAVAFFWAYMFGYIRGEGDELTGAGPHSLTIPYLKRDGALDADNIQPTRWLTSASPQGRAGAFDDLFRAVANYVSFGKDQRTSARINHKDVEAVLQAHVRSLDAAEVRQQVLHFIAAEGGLVDMLRDEAHTLRQQEPEREGGQDDDSSKAKAYEDLSNLIVLLIVQSAREKYKINLDLGKGGIYDNKLRALLAKSRGGHGGLPQVE